MQKLALVLSLDLMSDLEKRYCGRAIHFPAFVVRVRRPRATTVSGTIPIMSNCADPRRLPPDERFHEVAGIMAAGVLRLHLQSALSTDNRDKKLSQQDRLRNGRGDGGRNRL